MSIDGYASRGAVQYNQPQEVNVGDVIRAATPKNLLKLLLILMNERDSLKRINENPYSMNQLQLSGIEDTDAETEMSEAYEDIAANKPVYAKWYNTIIKYCNDLASTVGNEYVVLENKPCPYPLLKTIEQEKNSGSVPDMQAVDPVTGVPLYSGGQPVMVPGFRNPVPVLDSSGNPKRYTVTNKIIYEEGPAVSNIITDSVHICYAPTVSCPNRTKLYDWRIQGSEEDPGFVFVCNNQTRQEEVRYAAGTGVTPVPYVSVGDKIRAATTNAIVKNMIEISNGLDEQTKATFNTEGICIRYCQASCQAPCQISKQV